MAIRIDYKRSQIPVAPTPAQATGGKYACKFFFGIGQALTFDLTDAENGRDIERLAIESTPMSTDARESTVADGLVPLPADMPQTPYVGSNGHRAAFQNRTGRLGWLTSLLLSFATVAAAC